MRFELRAADAAQRPTGSLVALQRFLGYRDDAYLRDGLGQLLACDAMLMGRTTYESFAKIWPGHAHPWAGRLNAIQNYVFATTLDRGRLEQFDHHPGRCRDRGASASKAILPCLNARCGAARTDGTARTRPVRKIRTWSRTDLAHAPASPAAPGRFRRPP